MKPKRIIAICVNCGAVKEGFINEPCGECGLNPQQDEQTVAKSLYLSVARFDSEDEEGSHDDELREFSRRIRSGASIEYPPAELARLLEFRNSMGTVDGWHLVKHLLRIFFAAMVLMAALFFAAYFVQWLSGK